jgi:putative hydrolase
MFSHDASALGRDAMKAVGAMLRGEGRRDDQHWMERLMSDEQRTLFRETQAVMSLLEGFGDHVMDEVGKDLVPGVERISARFHGRRVNRTPFEKAMLRITGMDLKMEQYRKGEAFVAEIERLAGATALRRLWDGPETLPRPEEIERPVEWVRRMGLNQLEGGTA